MDRCLTKGYKKTSKFRQTKLCQNKFLNKFLKLISHLRSMRFQCQAGAEPFWSSGSCNVNDMSFWVCVKTLQNKEYWSIFVEQPRNLKGLDESNVCKYSLN